MRKTLFVIAALAAMTSCSQEMTNIEPQQPKGQTVTINCAMPEDEIAPDSKAAIGKDGKNILWRDYDKISVMVKNGTTWSANTLFERTKRADGKVDPDPAKDNSFTGSFATELEAGANTWYLLHPYSADIASIGNDTHTPPRVIYKTATGEYKLVIENAKQDYSKENKMGHLNLPMYGIGTGNGATTPTIRMNHFCSVFEITVTNKLTEAINVTSVSIENPEDKISGEFRVKVNDATETEPTPSMTLLANNSATLSSELNVTNCTLASDAVGKFYLLAKDFSLAEGKTITVTVKTDKNYVTSVKTLPKTMRFEPGKIHRTSVEYKDPTANAPEPDVTEKMDINFLEWTGIENLPIGMSAKGPSTPQYQFTDKGLILVGTSNGVNKLFIERINPAEYLTVVKANGNGATTVYGSTDNKAWTKLISVKHDKTKTEPVTLTADVNKLCKGAKYFRFDGAKTDQTIQSISFTKPADSTPAE